jgi:hypothetical protein
MKNTTEKSLLGKIQLFDRTGGITREVCNVCLPGSSLFLFVVWDGDLFEVSEMKQKKIKPTFLNAQLIG